VGGPRSSGSRLLRRRLGLAERRALFAALGAAAGAGAASVAGASWTVVVGATWDGAAIVYLALVLRAVVPLDGKATAERAGGEDDSNRASEGVLIAASTASLLIVGLMLPRVGHHHGASRVALTGLALGSVALSWACVHSVYALRYARIYYSEPVGGLAFGEGGLPTYGDFAYVALTIGMTYQVSDTDISKRPLRRAAIHHALISFLFGTVILAIAINTTAALINA